MQTSSVSGSGTSSTSSSSSAVPVQTLTQNDFLTLLMAQLQNQDPTAPVDDQQFAAQLAQFSSLQELTNIGTKLDSLISAQSSANQLQTASFVGKSVLFSSNQVAYDGATPVTLGAGLSLPADAAAAVVTNSSGTVVRTLSLGAEPAGVSTFTWDGKDGNGNSLPAGTYNVAVTAARADGQTVTASPLVQGKVTAVTFGSSGASQVLLVGGQQVSLSSVVQIVNPS
ncbi:MAG TPA: FlgD immunoglobulin-like domain containing protein [Anaeromyxobacteraceae bacterium]|nr:FlgD immunoglobulin-like domain containing protein [Anaeromyxobacteraceae bacterium]